MEYYIPDIILEQDYDVQTDTLPEKFGGLPIGLKLEHWPKCQDCGKPQTFVAQFSYSSKRLDLGRDGRFLFIFQCSHNPGMCETWSHSSGANACLIVEPEELVSAATSSAKPTSTSWLSKLKNNNAQAVNAPQEQPPTEKEVYISSWLAKDDILDVEVINSFYDDSKYLNISDEIIEKVTWSTRLGGVPRWIQSADEYPKPNWVFIGQLDCAYSFLKPPSVSKKWIQTDLENFEGRTHYTNGPNFGMGLAYLFIKNTEDIPQAKMFWQC